jgi:hypothetical protein
MMNPLAKAGEKPPAEAAPAQTAARAAAKSDAADSNDALNPLWLLAGGMALFFALAALLIGFD